MEILDVTKIEPKRKHPSIFEKFDALQSGEGFVIHNDHDPKPLYYQLLAERGPIFDWEYLENGPLWWKVQISKKDADPETVGEIAAKDFRKAEVFRKMGLDFCCGGGKTLEKACEESGLDINEVKKELTAIDNIQQSASQNFDSWEIDFLADYIVNTHHRYVNDALPALDEYTTKIARVHGSRHPELVQVYQHFQVLQDELRSHMQKEEQILFPYVKELVKMKNNQATAQNPSFGTVQNPINVMEHEHDAAGNIVKELRKLTDNYSVPEDACATYNLAFAKLKEFDDDLMQHIHLENNILFPKAVAMEKEILKRS